MTSKKILIVDDEEGIRESLKLILEDHHELILTENVATALEVLKNSKNIGLVLMDIKMPKTSGLDGLKTIKKKYPKLNVIIVTGYHAMDTVAEASKLGACGYIVKPFKSEDILETVKKNLGK